LLSASYSSTPSNPQHVLNSINHVEEVEPKLPVVDAPQNQPFRIFLNQVLAGCEVINGENLTEPKVVEQTSRGPFFVFSTDKERYYKQIQLSKESDAYDNGANRITNNDENDRPYLVSSTVLTKEQMALALNAGDSVLDAVLKNNE
jgi:hypothetical protein